MIYLLRLLQIRILFLFKLLKSYFKSLMTVYYFTNYDVIKFIISLYNFLNK